MLNCLEKLLRQCLAEILVKFYFENSVNAFLLGFWLLSEKEKIVPVDSMFGL